MLTLNLIVAALAVFNYPYSHYRSLDDRKPQPEVLKQLAPWARRGPFSSRHLKGTLEVPTEGEWTFDAKDVWVENGKGRVKCGVRLGEIELDLTRGPKTVRLQKGKIPFRVFFPMYRTKKEEIVWRGPGMTQFASIPDAALSHTAAEADDASWQVEAAPLKLLPSNPHVRRYEVTVAKTDFYDLRLIARDGYLWGNVTPSHLAVFCDGEERRTWFTTRQPGGLFQDAVETLFLTQGRHVIELRGTNVDNFDRWFGPESYNHDLKKVAEASSYMPPRVWLDFAQQGAYAMTLDLPATSVYRLGERVGWNFIVCADDPRPAFTVSVRELRGATSNEVWRGEAKFAAADGFRRAHVAFPQDRHGAFEYTVLDDRGAVLEGPWEFLVVDPTVRKSRASARPRLQTFADGDKVDVVDVTKESTGATSEHKLRDNGTSKVVRHPKGDYRMTGPVSRYGKYGPRKEGLTETDWFAVTLKVRHPGKAHLVVAWVPTDAYRRNVVELIDTVTSYFNGALYETRPTASGELVPMVMPFWPNGKTMDVLVIPSTSYHGAPSMPTAISRIELYEFSDGFSPMPTPACGWNADKSTWFGGEQGDLGPEKATTPLPWNDGYVVPAARDGQYHFHYDYKAYFQAWDRFAEYSAWNGDTRIVWPIHSYDMAHIKTRHLPRGNEIFCGGRGFTDNDRYTRDTAKLMLLACERHAIEFAGDIQLNSDRKRWGATIKNVLGIGEKELDGMFLSDGKQYPAQNLNPAHPLARKYLVGFYEDIARALGRYPAFKGIAIRNLSWATSVGAWFHNATVGYDDYTVGRFVAETGETLKETEYEKRKREILSDRQRRERWFKWRTEKVTTLRREILAGMRKWAPQCVLLAKCEGMDDPRCGAGLDGKALGKECGFDFAEGSCARTGIEINGLDPACMANFDVREGVERMTVEEKFKHRFRYGEGLNSAGAVLAAPYSTEGLAKALAERPLDRLTRGTYWCMPPGNDEVREFYRTWRALPSGDAVRVDPAASADCAVWSVNGKSGAAAYAVSVVDHPLRVKIPGAKRNLVTGEKVGETIELAPYALVYVACDRCPATFSVIGGSRSAASDKPKAYTGKSSFKVTKNPTWSSAKPYTLHFTDGTFEYGFTSNGLSYLARSGKPVFRGFAGRDASGCQTLLGVPWNKPQYVLTSENLSERKLRVTIATLDKHDEDSGLISPGFGSAIFANGLGFRRTYEIAAGVGEMEIVDTFSWDSLPGMEVQAWGGYRQSFANVGAGVEGVEVTALVDINHKGERYTGFRTAKWNAKERNFRPWLGWSVPWAEIWDTKTDVGYDLATDPRDQAGMEINGSLMWRLFVSKHSSLAGSHQVRRRLRIPEKRQSPENLSKWAR